MLKGKYPFFNNIQSFLGEDYVLLIISWYIFIVLISILGLIPFSYGLTVDIYGIMWIFADSCLPLLTVRSRQKSKLVDLVGGFDTGGKIMVTDIRRKHDRCWRVPHHVLMIEVYLADGTYLG